MRGVWLATLTLILGFALGVAGQRLWEERGSGARASPAEAPPLPGVGSAPPPVGVASLGRIEPKDGLIRVAGPALPVVVVRKLLVDKGDRVRTGQVIALLEGEATRTAEVERARADLANAKSEMHRNEELARGDVISASRREEIEMRLAVAEAVLHAAESELARTRVLSPIDGQVIDVYARAGVRVGQDGIVALGRTDRMYAIAEVYEADVSRVRLGQRATVTSPAFAGPLHGTVDRIGMKIGKQDALGTDPAARINARVVEVEICLDESEAAAGYTNLQVEIVFEG
jgi:HlyD family secretion protein